MLDLPWLGLKSKSCLVAVIILLIPVNTSADVFDEYTEVHQIQLQITSIFLGAAHDQRRILRDEQIDTLVAHVSEFTHKSRLFAEARLADATSSSCKQWAQRYLDESVQALSREVKQDADHWRKIFRLRQTPDDVVDDAFYEFGEAIEVCMDDY